MQDLGWTKLQWPHGLTSTQQRTSLHSPPALLHPTSPARLGASPARSLTEQAFTWVCSPEDFRQPTQPLGTWASSPVYMGGCHAHLRVLRIEGDVQTHLALSGHSAFSPPFLPQPPSPLLCSPFHKGPLHFRALRPHLAVGNEYSVRTCLPWFREPSPAEAALLAAGWPPHRHAVPWRTWYLPLSLFPKDPSFAPSPTTLPPSP